MFRINTRCVLFRLIIISLQEWASKNPHLTLGRHEQDTLNDMYQAKSGTGSKNDTDIWNRPRCGVPDYPILTQKDLSFYSLEKGDPIKQQQRKKRFTLFGGRWENTDLTYK